MNAITRIARRLARKIIKPAAMALADYRVHRAQARVRYFERVLCGLTPHDLKLKALQEIGRRNQIAGW
jgi:hypothetical protein